MRYFLLIYMFFLSIHCSYTEELVIPIEENKEVRLDMNEVILAGDNLEVADAIWKDGELEEAWDIFTKLEVELTNPTLLGNILLRKGILAQELGRNEEAGKYYLSFMYAVHGKELEEISKEERKSLENKILEIGMSQASQLKERILYKKNNQIK